MFRSYFYLNRLIIELNPVLQGHTLFEAFSQEKDRLILCFSSGAGENIYLNVSAGQNESYIQLKREFHRAKRNTASFFEKYLPLVLTNIEIATDDRIIRFNFGECSLFFVVRGKDTNVIMSRDSEEYESFKKISSDLETKLKKNINEKHYSPYFHKPYIELNKIGQINDFRLYLRENFPFISKEIISEVFARTKNSNDNDELKYHLENVIDEIELSPVSVFYETQMNKVLLAPATFRIFSRQDNKEFGSYQAALNEYLISKFKYGKIVELRSKISKNLEQQIEKISNKINQIKFKIESPSKEELYRGNGNLLLANIQLLKKGLKEVYVDDFYSGEKVKIKLNEELDGKGNIDLCFEKAKNEKQSRIYLRELYDNLIIKYKDLLNKKSQFESANKIDEYLRIMEDLNIKDGEQRNNFQNEKEYNFKHYIIENKYHLFVGKDSHNNDVLTVKFAKQNDYWFHARGVPGSHAVLRVENTKEVIPKPILKKAASIAAFHSKAKTSKMAPVSYTLKKYVTKKKGMEPGKVSLQKEDVLLVPPEIPQGCEFQSEQ